MFKLLFMTFLTIPLQNVLRINNVDYDFNNDLNYIVTSIGAMGYFLPKILRNNEICKTDDDCPLIMMCCQVEKKNYCCTPNNFVKMDLAYLTEPVKDNL